MGPGHLHQVCAVAASRQNPGCASLRWCYFPFLFLPLGNNLQVEVKPNYADGGFPLLHFYSLAPDSVCTQAGIWSHFRTALELSAFFIPINAFSEEKGHHIYLLYCHYAMMNVF